MTRLLLIALLVLDAGPGAEPDDGAQLFWVLECDDGCGAHSGLGHNPPIAGRPSVVVLAQPSPGFTPPELAPPALGPGAEDLPSRGRGPPRP